MKILLRQQDINRRARMYREVAAYRTLSHHRIPELIDTNAEAFGDMAHELYLVTAYVPGPTLEEYIRDRGPRSWAAALTVVDAILETLEHCHHNDVVHRDVKPDNIILRHGRVDDPVLVDFGQALGDRDSFETEPTEELGNRFLRLPELSVGSTEKDNPRTDITFAAGLLVYCLTGEPPAVLLNEKSCMPHQRPEVRAALAARLDAKERLDYCLGILDRAFRWDIGERWASASAFRDAIRAVDGARPLLDASEKVRRYYERPDVRSAANARRTLDQAIGAIHSYHGQMAVEMSGTFDSHQTGFARLSGNAVETRLAFTKLEESPEGHWVTIRVQAVGAELIIRVIEADGAEGPTLYRTPSEAPAFDYDFEDALRKVLLDRISRFV